MEDLLEQATEIQESLGRSYAVPDDLDEADLEAGVSPVFRRCSTQNNILHRSELDALALEEEDEGASYLADINKVPDFIDEAPLDIEEVRLPPIFDTTISAYTQATKPEALRTTA